MNPIIEIGRRVRYNGDICNLTGEGLIVAIKGTPGQKPARIGLVISKGDCYFDVILFDGRKMNHIHEHSLTGVGPRFTLMDRVHGPAMIDKAKQLADQRVFDEKRKADKERAEFEAGEAARKIEKEPIFYYNGIRDEKGAKLQKCWYSIMGEGEKYPAGTICINAREYGHFSKVVDACFAVKNASDLMTDYFEKDRIRVIPAHPLYAKVKAAHEASKAQDAKRAARRNAK